MAVVPPVECLGESNLTAPPEYLYLPLVGQQSAVAGHWVQPHVQAFADEVRKATRVKSIGTYNGHDPSVDRALDLFHAIGDDELADEICWFAVRHLERFGVDYIISRQRIFNPEVLNEWRWMADRGNPTQNHMDHVHISFEPTGSAEPVPTPEPIPEPVPQEEDDMPKLIGVDNDRGIFLVGTTPLTTKKSGGRIPARYIDSPEDVTALVESKVVPGYNEKPDMAQRVFDKYYIEVR